MGSALVQPAQSAQPAQPTSASQTAEAVVADSQRTPDVGAESPEQSSPEQSSLEQSALEQSSPESLSSVASSETVFVAVREDDLPTTTLEAATVPPTETAVEPADELSDAPLALSSVPFGRDCTVKVTAVGDILIHDTVRRYASVTDGKGKTTYDFRPNLQYVKPILEKGDLVLANLENPLAGDDRKLSGYPMFNAPQQLAADLKSVGFTTMLLTNNHSMDRGWSGLESTINAVKEAGLEYVGAYLSEEDKKNRLISVYNGVRIGLLAYTYGLNGFPGPKPGEEYKLGLIDKEMILADLRLVREMGADFVILSLHFGNEYERKPNRHQTSLVAELLAGDPETGLVGPDLILGHHPHVVQPFVMTEESRDSPAQAVMYSLGNFMSGQPFPYTYIGLILEGELTLTADGRRKVGPFNFTPTWCFRGTAGGKNYHRVIPMEAGAADPAAFGLTASQGRKMAESFEEMRKHVLSMSAQSN
ncbi:MAG: CapA family protein [Deltaproteobacteria bacterium]|nr:CapA family protein [Deltaproteobacteria bacterium]